MVKINVRDLIPSKHAISRSDGEFVGKSAIPYIKQGLQVVFDFNEVYAVTTSFGGSMIGAIMEQVEATKVRDLINAINLPHIYDMERIVSRCVRLHTDPEYRKVCEDVFRSEEDNGDHNSE